MIDINNWGWPQWLLLCLHMVSLIGSIINHGKQMGEYNGLARFIIIVVTIFILASGGFFK